MEKRAARELFETQKVRYVSMARASTDPTVDLITQVVHEAARTQTRRLVLLTGVPGSGKTLVGLRVVLGLIGTGQEINKGEEGGIAQWRKAVEGAKRPEEWTIHAAPQLVELFRSATTSRRGVKTKNLNKAVRRNSKRFPVDFMFQLAKAEATAMVLRFQIGTLKRGQHMKYLPYAFTENGVAMLSSVLNSERAVQVNIQIMRTFTRLRELLAKHKDLTQRLDDLERKFEGHDEKISLIFDAIRELISPPENPPRRIGFAP